MLAELRYDLSRRQRLIPHLRIWGVTQLFFIIGCIGVVACAAKGSWVTSVLVGILMLWFGRGYIFGLINVLLVRSQQMDIRIGEATLDYEMRNERWYICLDGLTAVRNLEKSVWTVQHWNGSVVNIPKSLLSDDVLNFLRDWVSRANDYRDTLGIRNPHPKKPNGAYQADAGKPDPAAS